MHTLTAKPILKQHTSMKLRIFAERGSTSTSLLAEQVFTRTGDSFKHNLRRWRISREWNSKATLILIWPYLLSQTLAQCAFHLSVTSRRRSRSRSSKHIDQNSRTHSLMVQS